MTSPSSGEQYDIVFAGAGPCSCIAASRLLDADPKLRILIVEYGPDTKNKTKHMQPAQTPRLLTDPEVVYVREAKPSPALNGRSTRALTGKAVGGGSSVNFMVYARASASDYDDWEKVHGNRGWGSDSLIPLLKKAESYQENDPNETHGAAGPIKVCCAPDMVQVGNDFLDAARGYDIERGFTEDINNFHECNKYGRWPRYIDGRDGTRSDVPHHYIYNNPNCASLTILTHYMVDSVIIDNGRAIGIKYQSVVSTQTTPYIALASKMVVIGAGAFGSPAILERSGIGSPEILRKCGIAQVVDLPGVGQNYMDHSMLHTIYHATPEIESMDEILYGTQDQLGEHSEVWTQTRKGLMTHNGVDAGIKMRPTNAELESMSPDISERWNNYFSTAPDKPLVVFWTLASAHGGPAAHSLMFIEKYFTIGSFLAYPISTGYTHITSRDPMAKGDFHAGLLDNAADLAALRWAYKKGRELARRMACYRGEVEQFHPTFDFYSDAAVLTNDMTHSGDEPDIEYTAEDDRCIDEFVRSNVKSTAHPCGTCAMKPREQEGVVDERLNVYGVLGLKVAGKCLFPFPIKPLKNPLTDCSILPANVGANLYNTAIAIGEKAAVLIGEDLGLQI